MASLIAFWATSFPILQRMVLMANSCLLSSWAKYTNEKPLQFVSLIAILFCRQSNYPSPSSFVIRKLLPFTFITVFGNVCALLYVSTTVSTTELIDPTRLVKKDILSKVYKSCKQVENMKITKLLYHKH